MMNKPESHSGSIHPRKNLDDTFNFGDQFLHDKPTEDDQEKSKAREESDSTIPDSSHQTVTSTPPVIAPFTEVLTFKPSLQVTSSTDQDVKLQQSPHTLPETLHVIAPYNLIEKYSVLPGPESVKNQESEKSPKEIIKAKKEQDEEKQDSTYSIRSTDKVDLEEFDLKKNISKQDKGNETQIWRTAQRSITQGVDHLRGFKPIQKSRENKIERKTYDIGSFIKWFCRRTGKKKLCKADLEGPAFNHVKAFHKNSVFLQYQMDECHKLLTNKVDLSNPEGHQILRNIYEPLPLGGPPSQVTIQLQFFFNKDLDYLLTGDKERKMPLYPYPNSKPLLPNFGLEALVHRCGLRVTRYDISVSNGITHW
ncbi:hypothetical protein Tco_1300363 [Tanacetum coccineum]